MTHLIEVRPGRSLNVTVYPNKTSDATAFLIHGLGGNSQQWREQIHALSQTYTLVIPDLLGQGNSPKPKPAHLNPYTYPELEQDVMALFQKFASDKNVVIGHSYGGALATALAIEHQDRIDHLVLIAPMACTSATTIPSIYQLPAWLMEWLRPLLEKHFEQLAFAPTAAPSLLETERLTGRKNPMYVINALIKGTTLIPTLDVTMLTIPTLILLGKQDCLIPPAVSEQFYQQIPKHECIILNDAAHLVMLEQPEKVNQLILEFLAKN